MKYMLMIYDNPDTREKIFSGAGGEQLLAEVDAVMARADRVGRAGRRRGARRSQQHPHRKRRRRRAGGHRRPVRRGQGAHGRLPLVECDSLERATEIAARWPSAPFAPLEVRPVMDAGGEEM